MGLFFKDFFNDEDVVKAVAALKSKGINDDHIYVISHDDERTKRVADNADASTIGFSEQDFGTAAKNIFRKKGDELRAKFDEIGFSKEEAKQMEEELDKGKVYVIVTDAPPGLTL